MRRILGLLSLAAGVLAASGCALPYYWQAASGHLELLRKREPIKAVLGDPALRPDVKQALGLVVEMREFAVQRLALPDNDSYRSYVDLGRPYVVWNVVAAEEFATAPVQWCFPVLGCVSYRGYFKRDDAERFAARLGQGGMDTYIAGASAYSTLGYFSDPVLSTMLVGGEPYVAGVLFHELAHQKLYLKGDSELNEAFATAVQQYGTLEWLTARGSSDAAAAYRMRLRRQDDFTALIRVQQDRLQRIYAADFTDAAKRGAKQAAFEQMRADYAALTHAWGGVSEYEQWFGLPLNNAQLASVATYRRWLPGLMWYLEREGLTAFYTQMAALGRLSAAERESLLQEWLDAASDSHSAAVPLSRVDVGRPLNRSAGRLAARRPGCRARRARSRCRRSRR
jgi:predicted aminopeptidase